MLTIRTLCVEMEASGRHLSPRAARDWCNKRLLPHPPRHGRGRGKGSESYWSDPRVLQQAQAAYDLFARHPRADFVRLSLWLMGFRMELRDVRAAYGKSIERHLRSVFAQGGNSPDDNVGALAAMFSRQWSKKTIAPLDARHAIAGLAETFLGVFYGTDDEPVEEGLADLWQKAAPFVISPTTGVENISLRDEDLGLWSEYLKGFASLRTQQEMIRSASDYELIRARRLLRFVLEYFRRIDPSSKGQDSIQSPTGWLMIVFGRPAVPVLIRLFREDAIRHEIMVRLLAFTRDQRRDARRS